MKSLFYNFTFILLIYTKHLCSDELINEFNFSAAIDGIYILEDGRKFEALSHEGHIKNNIGNYGIIKCNSLTETKKENLIFLKVICESSINDGNKIWSVLERNNESFNAGIGKSVIIDATGRFKKLKGIKCIYAVTKYDNSSFVKEKCDLPEGLIETLKSD